MAKSPSLPSSVRSDKPPYILAYERFTEANPDQIEALVAFGLFIRSDHEWASNQVSGWPSDELIAYSYGRMLTGPEVEKTNAAAIKIVDEHRQLLVSQHEKKYLEAKWRDIEERIHLLVSRHSKKHFWKGVSEATTGAFCWTMLCIAIAVGSALIGIDLIHGLSNISHVEKPTPAPAPPAPPTQ